mgnify:CR=1 FL=1
MAFISNGTTILDNGAFSASLGSLVHLKTLTASSSGTLSFVDGSSGVVFDNTYPIYKFEFINIHAGTDQANFQFNGSTNSGSAYNTTKTSNFYYSYNRGSDGANNFQAQTSLDLAQSTSFQDIAYNSNVDNYSSLVGSLMIFNPSSTTFVKHFISTTNDEAQTSGEQGLSQVCHVTGYMNTTSAVDAIRFQFNSGNMDSGKIKLYGIKDS